MLVKIKMYGWFMLIAIMINMVFTSSSMAATDPYKAMKVITDNVFANINLQSADIENDPNILQVIVKQYVIDEVQVKYTAAIILGNYYKTATAEQRMAYFTAFERYLVQNFAQVLSFYDGQHYSIEKAKSLEGKSLTSVRVLLQDSAKKQPAVRLDFLWRKNTVTGEWQMYDLLAEGVSMITTKQNEWAGLLRRSGIDGLTEQLNRLANLPVSKHTNSKK